MNVVRKILAGSKKKYDTIVIMNIICKIIVIGYTVIMVVHMCHNHV